MGNCCQKLTNLSIIDFEIPSRRALRGLYLSCRDSSLLSAPGVLLGPEGGVATLGHLTHYGCDFNGLDRTVHFPSSFVDSDLVYLGVKSSIFE